MSKQNLTATKAAVKKKDISTIIPLQPTIIIAQDSKPQNSPLIILQDVNPHQPPTHPRLFRKCSLSETQVFDLWRLASMRNRIGRPSKKCRWTLLLSLIAVYFIRGRSLIVGLSELAVLQMEMSYDFGLRLNGW